VLILLCCTPFLHCAFWWMILGHKIISSTLIGAKAMTLIAKVPMSNSSISIAAAVDALFI